MATSDDTGTYIGDWDATQPEDSDVHSKGAAEIRKVKACIDSTFPNFTGAAVTATEVELNYVDGVTSDIQSQFNGKAGLAVENTWTAQQVPFDGTLTDGATINWDADANGQIVSVTLAGNRTLAAPTNVLENAFYVLRVHQDATGSRTLTWDSAYKFPGGVDVVLTASAPSAVDIISFIGGSGNVMYCVGVAKRVS